MAKRAAAYWDSSADNPITVRTAHVNDPVATRYARAMPDIAEAVEKVASFSNYASFPCIIAISEIRDQRKKSD